MGQEINRRLNEYSNKEAEFLREMENKRNLSLDIDKKKELIKLFEEEMVKKQLELEQKEQDLVNKEVFRVELEIEREKDYLENQKYVLDELNAKEKLLKKKHQEDLLNMQ